MLLITGIRRKRLKSHPFPSAWERVLEHVPLCGLLPEPDRFADGVARLIRLIETPR